MTLLALLASKILNRVPKFLRGPNLGRFQEAYAATLDGSDQALRIGMTGNNPLICPAECLPTIALDRSIPLFTSIPVEFQREMLADWIMLHRTRSMHYGVMRLVRHYFDPGPYPRQVIVHQNGDGSVSEWHELDAAGEFTITPITPSNYNYDGRSSLWSRWWHFLDMTDTGYAPPNTYNDGHTYNDGSVYDAGDVKMMTPGMAADIVSADRSWKRAGTWLNGIVAVWQSGALNINATPVQDPSGWWSLPNGAGTWEKVTRRPPYMSWLYDNPA